MKSFFYSIMLTLTIVLFSACAGTLQEYISSDPPHADVYWGKTKAELKKTGHETPYFRSISGSNWESWCYQVKKDGYRDSEIICREEEGLRLLDFYLVPFRTTITSEPTDSIICWGATRDQIENTEYRTPLTITAKEHPGGASWKDWYFQVKKKGYYDSEIVFLPQQPNDREVHFELKPRN